jgi:dihydrofolate reductase
VVKSMDDALFVVKEMDVNEVFVIGGGEIFKEVFSKADKIIPDKGSHRDRGRCFLS